MDIKKDLIVIGGGVAGICGAIAAARNGLSVALVHNRPVLGGNGSSEVGVGINGACTIDYSPTVYAREGGIVNEIKDRVQKETFSHTSYAMLDMVYFDLIYQEKNIELYLNTHINKVEMEDNEIKSVSGFQLNSENEFTFFGELFMDCSGDGIVGFQAGAAFMIGREAKDEFNESLAPDQKDNYLQGSTILWKSIDMGKKIDYEPPLFAHKIEGSDFEKNIGRIDLHRDMYGKGLNSLWWMEYGGQCDTIHQNEEVTLELRKLVYGFWDYIKNSGKIEGTENYLLTNLSPIAGKRESRRFIGDYVLNQNDIFEKTAFEDSICTGGWVIDCHAPYGIYDNDKASNWVTHRGVYNIPYRSIYSKNINNLFFGGRIFSTTHIAHGSTRVIATGAAVAQAAGTAASLCKKYGITPREVLDKMEELQAILTRQDQFILARRESYNPALLECSISATQTGDYKNNNFTDYMLLEQSYYLALPSTKDAIDSVDILVKNNSQNVQILRYRVYTGKNVENFLPTIVLQEKDIHIENGFDGYITLNLEAKNLPDKKAYLRLLSNENLKVGYSKFELTGAPTFIESFDPTSGICIDGVGMKIQHTKNICFQNVLPKQDIFNVANLLNGYSRPYGTPNLWLCDAKNKPTILIEYDGVKYCDEMQFVFNDNLKKDCPEAPADTVIKDYNLFIDDEKIEIRDNYNRVNIHKMGRKIKKIKVEILENYGNCRFEIFSIRLY